MMQVHFCLSNWASNLKGKVYIILGMTRNRDVESFCTFFKDIVYQGTAVTVESEPSSYSASIVAKKASKTGIPFIEADSLQEAIKDISINNNEEPATIIITGSLFLIADFYKL